MKKFFVFALCMLAVSINYSCGDEEEPTPDPTPQKPDVSYYSYDVKYNKDVQTLLDLLNVKLYLYDGEELPAAKKSMAADCALIDSLLIDINKPYYIGVGMDCGPIEGLGGATIRDFLSVQEFRTSVLPYLKEELAKKGIDVKKLNLVADFAWNARVIVDNHEYASQKNEHMASTYDSIKALVGEDASDEAICDEMLRSMRRVFRSASYVEHWNPQTKKFERE